MIWFAVTAIVCCIGSLLCGFGAVEHNNNENRHELVMKNLVAGAWTFAMIAVAALFLAAFSGIWYHHVDQVTDALPAIAPGEAAIEE